MYARAAIHREALAGERDRAGGECDAASFFYDKDRPLRAEEIADPYRRDMLLTARATSRAERTWLRETLGEKPPAFDNTGTESDPRPPAAPAS